MRQGRGALTVVSALIAASVMMTAALAQGRNNQPIQPNQPNQANRARGPELPSSGAQTEAVDLNEGKSPAELFKAGCAVCHQSAAGLAKGRSGSELVGFLRQHYTSGTQHAASLAGFLAGTAGRGGPAAAATPARLNPNAPIERPPAAVGREEEGRKPQEAARPPQEREPPAKRKPPVVARPVPHSAPPPVAAAPATTEAAAHSGDAPTASAAPPAPPPPAAAPVEEKPAAPEIPL